MKSRFHFNRINNTFYYVMLDKYIIYDFIYILLEQRAKVREGERL